MALNLMMSEDDQELRPRITVFGVGGAGGNAVNNMIEKQLDGVEFVVANTDAQALAQARAKSRVQIGPKKTEGLGAGANPAVGAAAAEETIEDIVDHLMGAHMCFITAGMGGGTGTGAAPIIAQAAREMGILTVGVVTKPFTFEGAKRMRQADSGIEALQKVVDTLIVIPNQNLFRLANEKTTFTEAFAMADDVLYQGVKGVTDLMVRPGIINLDFADVRAVMNEMGKAMMGTGESSGENRAVEAAERAIANPLLDEISLNGAKGVLINIVSSGDMTLFEFDEAANIIREKVDADANIIVGSSIDSSLGDRIRVSVVATGIDVAEGTQAETPLVRRPMKAPLTQTPSATQHHAAALAADDDLPVPPRRVAIEPAPAPAPRPTQAQQAEDEMPAPAYRPAAPAAEAPAARLREDVGDFFAPQRPQSRPVEPSQTVQDRLAAAINRGVEGRARPVAAAPAPAPDAPAPQAGPMGGLARMIGRMAGAAENRPSATTLAERVSERMASRRSQGESFDGIDDPDRSGEPVEIPAFLRRQAN